MSRRFKKLSPCKSVINTFRAATFPAVDALHDDLRVFAIDFHKSVDDWQAKAERIVDGLARAGFTTLKAPKWSNWCPAGSWMRERASVAREFEPMMHGEICCGCGRQLYEGKGMKSICSRCWSKWLPRHRRDYRRAFSL